VTVRAGRGLTEDEAARLHAEQEPYVQTTSRSSASIVRANVFTVFNLILAVAGAATLAFGEWQDALFLGVLFSNSAIGITQEIRAKRALDRLAALVAPNATVVRDGVARVVAVDLVVPGDVLRVQPGDQVVADGELVHANGIAFDESILTGESRPVLARPGARVRSGSFVVEGSGELVVEAVGQESYAARIAGEARAFRHPRSPLERALNRLLLTLVAVIAPLGVVLGIALWERRTPLDEAVPTSVAAVVTLVPEGLILLASLTFAVAALRMARRGALVQQLNAVESLASVDVVCLDKTGTLTMPRLEVIRIVAAPGVAESELERRAAEYAAIAPVRNPTVDALAERFPAPTPQTPSASVPFSSRHRFGAVRSGGTWIVVGAPELFALGSLRETAELEARSGRRVVALGTSRTGISADHLPPDVTAAGLAVLGERLRPEARATVEFFRRQGVELKIVSGDRPETVAAVAADLGIPVGRALDGRELPESRAELAALLDEASVIGRISPQEKRRVVETLRDEGRYVAMVGDGVNDVPALKAARLAIAQGTGTQMAKSVADVVLVRGDFAAVPAMLEEGRKILRNLQRVTKLFVTKSVFASVLIVSVGLTPTAYPLLPRHLTLAATLTIGVPAFFLALAPSSGGYRIEGFLRDVASFSVPAGTAAGLGVLSSYLFALNVLDLPLIEARTVATTVLVGVGLYLILALEAEGARRSAAVLGLCAALAACYVLTLWVPFAREFFELAPPDPVIFATALAGAGLAVGGRAITPETVIPGQRSFATAQ
jgi:magnesium-transporting ATPase (P-type)